MTTLVHIKIRYQIRGSHGNTKTITIQIPAERWDPPRYNQASFIRGYCQPMKARPIDFKEVRRTQAVDSPANSDE